MMTLLIPGPNFPGIDIDVYTGVETYDCVSKERFNMRTALRWTVNDFPAYGHLSGQSTNGDKAYPTCNEDTTSVRLRDKLSYVSHRRFLPTDHLWKKSRDFNSKPENRAPPSVSTGEDCVRQLENVPSEFGKLEGKKRKGDSRNKNQTKWSIFFELPYQHKLLLHHNIDVMHVKKRMRQFVGNTVRYSKKNEGHRQSQIRLTRYEDSTGASLDQNQRSMFQTSSSIYVDSGREKNILLVF